MSLVDDIFYEVGPLVTSIFKDKPTTFRITKKVTNPYARPEDVTEYAVPRLVEIYCSAPYATENSVDTGGVSRQDITSTHKDHFFISVPEANIPSDVTFPENSSQTQVVEVQYKGRWISLATVKPIGSDYITSRILEFKS